jgi:hypothetical protein
MTDEEYAAARLSMIEKMIASPTLIPALVREAKGAPVSVREMLSVNAHDLLMWIHTPRPAPHD